MEEFHIAIIGGGIIGAATMYKLAQHNPDLKIILIEKEQQLASHQTGNNSGVIHSGLYYKPGSLKAKNCVAGRHEIVAFAQEHGIKHDVCGKIVVATAQAELPNMDKIYQNGIDNGTEGLVKITADQIKDYEPECVGIGGLYVPCTGIIDFKEATEKMVEIALAKNTNNKLVLGEEAISFDEEGDQTTITTTKSKYAAGKMIFCGGLQADRLAKKNNIKLKEKIVGFRGDYYELAEHARYKIKNLIYPVPNPDFPFLGVHFTRMVTGEIECGPNAVFTFKREGYGKTDFNLKDTVDALSYGGTWKLFLGNMSFGVNEYRRAFSKKLFLKTLQRLIPSLVMEDLVTGRAGVRAMLLGTDGDTRDDFRIEYGHNSIHVLNAPSPAATGSLAIGNQIREMAEEKFGLKTDITL